jgi:hypothetical protein
MIHFFPQDPRWLFFVTAGFFLGCFVVPYWRVKQFRPTPWKFASLVVVLGIGIFSRNFLATVFITLWPLSFIWFPEYWGNFTGFFRWSYIDQKTPPVVVSFVGWFFLLGYLLKLKTK